MAYERMFGPLGPRRDDQLAALIAATIANAFRDKNDRAAQVSDFVPDWAKSLQEVDRGGDPQPDREDRSP